MARIIVTADPSSSPEQLIVLEESVSPVHLSSDHAAAQLIERLAWAVDDAESAASAAPSTGDRAPAAGTHACH